MPKAALSRRPISAHKLLSEFISLGDNCEFGLVQRRAGVEQLGLLRFAFSRIDPLIEALNDGFADLDPVEVLTIEQPWNDEYISCFGIRGLYHHTFMRTGSVDPIKLRQQEVARITFLRRRLMEDLESGGKIFVRKSNERAPENMAVLYRSLQRFGRNSLLWVELADDTHEAGTVERVEGGLVRGYVDRFPPYGEATAVSFECWLQLCIKAYGLLRGPFPQEMVDVARSHVGQSAHPAGCNNVTSDFTDEIEPLQHGTVVFRHFTAAAISNAVVLCPAGMDLRPGDIHTASIWVWIPQGFRGKLIAPSLTNATRPFVQPAVMVDRDCWQRIWVHGVMPENATVHAAIWADLEADDIFYTTLWVVEQAEYPACYLLPDSNAATHVVL